MATSEKNGDGRAMRPGGVYRHPATGEEIIAQPSEKFGNVQADAFTRGGFEYVGPAPKDTPVALDPYAAPAVTDSTSDVDKLQAQLAAAQQRVAELEGKKANKRTPVAETPGDTPAVNETEKGDK